MSGYNIDIADMQCSVFRMAQSKWKMSPSDCALFDFDSEIWKESSYLLSLYDYCTSKKLCASGSSPHSKMLHSALFNYHFFQLLFLVSADIYKIHDLNFERCLIYPEICIIVLNSQSSHPKAMPRFLRCKMHALWHHGQLFDFGLKCL